MVFQESNNRDVARKYAEYITSVPLRRFVAEKVREYCGDLPLSIFDGACGSGQLEQFLTVGSLYAVDIQASPLLHIPDNFPDATVKTVNENFFNAIDDVSDTDTFDCVIMNPPFSLQYKAQSADIREKISAMMPYKKTSGVLDDAFYVLASMKARFS
ncbi:SAM-dependent DNA methyltransferase, partial [Escherichia coli]|nr:SAM-dependent DNA methyltransferase [Escherichia coli]